MYEIAILFMSTVSNVVYIFTLPRAALYGLRFIPSWHWCIHCTSVCVSGQYLPGTCCELNVLVTPWMSYYVNRVLDDHMTSVSCCLQPVPVIPVLV